MKRFLQIVSISFTLVLMGDLALHLFAQPAPIGPFGNTGFNTALSISAQTATLTAQQMVPGVVTTSFAGATTLTTDTAANLCTLFPQVGASGNQNFAWDWYLKSAAGNTNTIPTGGTGVTFVGSGTTAASSVRHFKIILTACPVPGTSTPTAAAVLYSLETALF